MNKKIIVFPKNGKPALADDDWQVWGLPITASSGKVAENPEDLTGQTLPTRKVLVPFGWWLNHADKPEILTRSLQGNIGVWFSTNDDILKHTDIIQSGRKLWPLVAAHFPIFRDGRSFSTAALLRNRFEWQGEVRAIGDVLIDQLLQMARVGFDSFDLRADQDLNLGLKQFNLFTTTTQNSWRKVRSTLATDPA